MTTKAQELLFITRADFRAWLSEQAAISEGVWLIFSKTKEVITLSANDALEEALCFGWIDGQMQRLDETRYRKYFARRRTKSPWSAKNKKLVEQLRAQGAMTALGEEAIATAKKNGTWAVDAGAVSEEQIAKLAEKLSAYPKAYAGYQQLTPSARKLLTRRQLSFKTEEARERDFAKIVAELSGVGKLKGEV